MFASNRNEEQPGRFRSNLRSILLGIILFTLPFYCLGFIIWGISPRSDDAQRIRPADAIPTESGDQQTPSPTASATPTVFTATTSPTASPTRRLPSATPFPIPQQPPTSLPFIPPTALPATATDYPLPEVTATHTRVPLLPATNTAIP